MNVQELATAAAEGLPVKVLLLNNESLGMVRQQQDMFWDGRRVASDLRGPASSGIDFAAAAAAFGMTGRTVADPAEVEGALAATLAEPGPALLDVRIAPEADALPMFLPGGAARDMVG
jgi:acetolactate synthase-1/2/3 large subunit